MNKEQENQFKEHIKEMAREEIQRTFTDNLMETLNSAFIFKYVETLELKCKKQKEAIDDYKEDISNLLNIINKNCYELKCTSDEWLVIQKYQDKEVSE